MKALSAKPHECYSCVYEMNPSLERHLEVRFVYESLQMPEQLSIPLLTAEMLACLSLGLRCELIDDLLLGDTDKLFEIVKKISQQYPELAHTLQSYIEVFDYLPILNALDNTT